MTAQTKNLARLILVIQEKGGVAKTFLAVHLKSWLDSLGANYRPVDLDLTEGVLTRVYPKPESATVSPDTLALKSGESLMPQLMDRVLDGHRFIIDCGANTGEAWSLLFSDVWPDLPRLLDEKGVPIVLFVPVTRDEKTGRFFEHYKQLFPKATIVMVRVRRYKTDDFPTPEHPAPLIMDLPIIPEALFTTYLDKAVPVDRIAASSGDGFGISKAFARGYVPQLHEAFRKFQHLLIP
jgi:hypothetical protein